MKKKIRFFLDFDGTITLEDVVDALLERFASKEWKQIEQDWVDGKIGSRECLARQIGLVEASSDELETFLETVHVDPHFAPFLEKAKDLGIQVTIVSDGFDRIIGPVLKRVFKEDPDLLLSLSVFCNSLEPQSKGFKAGFMTELCEHGCANCKEEVIRDARAPGDVVVFVGDGHSDRYAALEADEVFAKGALLKFCTEHGVKHRAFSDFKEIETWMTAQKKPRSTAQIKV